MKSKQKYDPAQAAKAAQADMEATIRHTKSELYLIADFNMQSDD